MEIKVAIIGPFELMETLMTNAKAFPSLQIMPFGYLDVDETIGLLRQCKDEVDVLLFAGPIPYEIALAQTEIALPMLFIPLSGMRSPTMRKAVIFDFDGLIIDTETAWYEAYKETLAQYQLELPLEQFCMCIGTDDTLFFEFLKEKLGERCTIEEVEGNAQKLHTEKMKNLQARPGVHAFLLEAKELGYKIGLASSSSKAWVTHFLRELELLHFFEVLKTRDDVEQVKPAPDLYLKAVEALQVSPSEAVAFEDSANGAKAALSAGLKCVVVPNPVTASLAFERYDVRLASMADTNLREVMARIEQLESDTKSGR